jgi:uncharacterized membrane protein
MEKRAKTTIKAMSVTAIAGALVFVASRFLMIPYPSGAGYFNFGDAIIIFTSLFFGPIEGVISGAIGAALSDLSSGYAFFIPFTIVAKSLEALLAYFANKLLNKSKFSAVFAGLLAPIPMILTYLVSYLILGEWGYVAISTPLDILQGALSSAVAIPLYYLIKKVKIFNR